MGKMAYKYVMSATAFFIVVMQVFWPAGGIAFNYGSWQAFTCDIFSPARMESDVDIAQGSRFGEKYLELYLVSCVKRAELHKYCEQSYGMLAQGVDNPICPEHKRDGMADMTPGQPFEDIIAVPVDAGVGFSHRVSDMVTGRSWFVPFSLPVKSIENNDPFFVPDAISIGFEVNYFRVASDVKMLGSGSLHFPSVIGRNQTAWVNPESVFLRFEWKEKAEDKELILFDLF